MSADDTRARISRPLLGFVVLGLALAVVGTVLLLLPKDEVSAAEPSDNVTIISQATAFATEYNTYDAADAEDYQGRITPLMTEEFGAATVQTITTLFPTLEEREQVSTDPQVKQVAIESRDDDSARVLVATDATVTNTDLDGTELRQMRWVLTMQLENGSWVVDAFESVPAEPATGTEVPGGTPDPAGTPTPSPTTAPSEDEQ